jgi:hypothetical protein
VIAFTWSWPRRQFCSPWIVEPGRIVALRGCEGDCFSRTACQAFACLRVGAARSKLVPMSELRRIMLGVALLIGYLSGCSDSSSSLPAAEARNACQEVVTLLSQVPNAESGPSEEDSDGCHVALSGTLSNFPEGALPDQLVRAELNRAGWEEDDRHAADGPDGTAFGLRKGSVLCLFEGSWAHQGDQQMPGGLYTLRVRCTEDPSPVVSSANSFDFNVGFVNRTPDWRSSRPTACADRRDDRSAGGVPGRRRVWRAACTSARTHTHDADRRSWRSR